MRKAFANIIYQGDWLVEWKNHHEVFLRERSVAHIARVEEFLWGLELVPELVKDGAAYFA